MHTRSLSIATPSVVGLGTFVIQFVWWLGWNPGLASPDAVDQLAQAKSGVIFDLHPAAHTLYLGLLSQGGDFPERVTLFQMLWYSILVGVIYHMLRGLGVRGRGVITLAMAVLPTISVTLLTFWKDVPFSLVMLGLLLLVIEAHYDPTDFWHRPSRVALVGVSLASLALFRHNGFLTVIAVVVVMVWIWRNDIISVMAAVAIGVLIFVGVTGPLYQALEVREDTIPLANVFLPDLARAYVDHGDEFSDEQIEALERIAPLEVWEEKYNCTNTTPLLFDAEFDTRVVALASSDYWQLEQDIIAQFPDAPIEHRLCSSSYLYNPFQTAYVQYPPVLPQTEPELVIDPVVDRALSITKPAYVWMEKPGNFWVTWRPALMVLAGLIASVAVLQKRPTHVGAWLYLLHFGNVMATSPAHEFRYAFPLYLMAPVLIGMAVHGWSKYTTSPNQPTAVDRVSRSARRLLSKLLPVGPGRS